MDFESAMSAYEKVPLELWENIFCRLKYEKICELRLVCKAFNNIGKEMLEKKKSKMKDKLEQHLKMATLEVIKANGHIGKCDSEFIFLDFLNKSGGQLCDLFRAFIGRNVECFTLGKMIDLLSTFFMVLEDDELWESGEVDFRCVLPHWRKSYDMYQMKCMGEFDYCLYMWLRLGETISMHLNPIARLLYPHVREDWKIKAERLKSAVREAIFSVHTWYKRDFNPSEDDMEKEPVDNFKYFNGEDQADDYGCWDLSLNEHWTPYQPPELDDAHYRVFEKFLCDCYDILIK